MVAVERAEIIRESAECRQGWQERGREVPETEQERVQHFSTSLRAFETYT